MFCPLLFFFFKFFVRSALLTLVSQTFQFPVSSQLREITLVIKTQSLFPTNSSKYHRWPPRKKWVFLHYTASSSVPQQESFQSPWQTQKTECAAFKSVWKKGDRDDDAYWVSIFVLLEMEPKASHARWASYCWYTLPAQHPLETGHRLSIPHGGRPFTPDQWSRLQVMGFMPGSSLDQDWIEFPHKTTTI